MSIVIGRDVGPFAQVRLQVSICKEGAEGMGRGGMGTLQGTFQRSGAQTRRCRGVAVGG